MKTIKQRKRDEVIVRYDCSCPALTKQHPRPIKICISRSWKGMVYLITTKNLRKSHKQTKQPCFVCGKYVKITEAHHLVSLDFLKPFINMQINLSSFVNILVFLCPNHHSYIHLSEIEDETENERQKFLELISKKQDLLESIREIIGDKK